MRAALGGTRGVQAYDTALAVERLHARDAKLDCFLQREIHAFATRYRLCECAPKRRFTVDRVAWAKLDGDTVFVDMGNRGCKLDAAVENDNLIAGLARSTRTDDARALPAEFGARGERARHVDARKVAVDAPHAADYATALEREIGAPMPFSHRKQD